MTPERNNAGRVRRGLRVLASVAGTLIGTVGIAHAQGVPTGLGQAADVRFGYVDGPYGQIHYAISKPEEDTGKPALVLLHQTPNTIAEFGALIGAMGKDRVTIAFDTPGYGGSSVPPAQPRIEDYARAVAGGLRTLGYGDRKVDVLGNHTGAFIATALATAEPKLVGRLALFGVFVVSDERLPMNRAKLRHPESNLEVARKYCERQPIVEAAYAQARVPDAGWLIQADAIRGPGPQREYGHEAAFEYASRARSELRRVEQPVFLMLVRDGVEQYSRDSAPLFPRSLLVELPDIRAGKWTSDGLFHAHVDRIAWELRKVLD